MLSISILFPTHKKSLVMYLIIISALIPTIMMGQELDSSDIEEILVYSQKRSETSQTVPIATSVMTAQDIQESGIFDITELTDLNSSLSYDTANNWQNSSLKIRGIGTIGNGRTFEGSVGVFIDGIYRPRSAMAMQDMLDVERIEVLKGPQDTLFGKNTVAGAVALYSTAPTLNEFSGQADVRAGNLNQHYASGQLNIPIGTNSAIRLAVSDRFRDGFIESLDSSATHNEINRQAAKLQFLTQLTDEVEVRLILDYMKSDSDCCLGAPQVFSGPTSAVVGSYAGLNGLTYLPAPEAERKRSISLNGSPREKVDDIGFAAMVNWEIGTAILRSITSYRNWEHQQIDLDVDFVPADLLRMNEPSEINYASQEFNLNFTSGNTDYLFGLFAANEDVETVRAISSTVQTDNYLNTLLSAGSGATQCLPPLLAVDCAFPIGVGAFFDDGDLMVEGYEQDATTLAVFAHAITDLSEDSQIIFGARYNVEKKDGSVAILTWYDSPIARAILEDFGVPDDGTPRNGLDVAGTIYSPPFEDATRDTEFTGTIAYQYSINDETMIYGKYDRGFKAGGVNLFREAVVTNTQTYAPELADSFEVGLKSSFLNGAAQSNLAIFRTEFTDLQINFFDGLGFRTENSGKAISAGVEIENEFQVTNDLIIDFTATWLDAYFEEMAAPELSYLIDRDTPRAPEVSATLGASWTRSLTAGMDLFVRGFTSFRSSHFVGSDVSFETKQDSYSLYDLTVGLRGRENNWELSGWCRNCADESYRTILFHSTFQAGSLSAYLNEGRSYGITLRTWF